jgi:hypothetical protein
MLKSNKINYKASMAALYFCSVSVVIYFLSPRAFQAFEEKYLIFIFCIIFFIFYLKVNFLYSKPLIFAFNNSVSNIAISFIVDSYYKFSVASYFEKQSSLFYMLAPPNIHFFTILCFFVVLFYLLLHIFFRFR